jgi:hypothetical protein
MDVMNVEDQSKVKFHLLDMNFHSIPFNIETETKFNYTLC